MKRILQFLPLLSAFARRAFVVGLIALVVSSLAAAQPAATTAAPPPRPAGLPSKTWEKALVQALKPTPGGVKYEISVSETSLEATSIREFTAKINEASRNMVELRSGRSPGSYGWSLSTPWVQQMNMGRCEFKDIDVRISYAVDVILIAGPIAQDSSARHWWDANTDGTYATHFARLRLLRDSARALHQRLRLLSNSSCGELANIANTASREARFQINEQMRAIGGQTTPLTDR